MLATPWAEGQTRAFGANAWVERVDGRRYLTALLLAHDRLLDGTFDLGDGPTSPPLSVWGQTVSTSTTCGFSGGLRVDHGFGNEYVLCADRSTKAVFRTPLEDFGQVSNPLFTLDEDNPSVVVRYFALMHPCGPVIGFELDSGYGLYVTDLATLQTSYAFWGELDGHKIYDVHCVGDALFFTHDQVVPYEQWVRKPDGTLVKLIANADSMAVGLGSDGIDHAWMQAYAPDANLAHWGRVELWTSPFATTPQTLAPKLLGRLPIDWLDFTLVVGAGYAAHSTIPGEQPRLYRLSDGAWASAPKVPDLQLPRFIYIDEQEAFLWGAKADGLSTNYTTIVRMPISAFAPFEPLPP